MDGAQGSEGWTGLAVHSPAMPHPAKTFGFRSEMTLTQSSMLDCRQLDVHEAMFEATDRADQSQPTLYLSMRPLPTG